MLALAANKNDLYEKEEVEENEGISFAKELGAIFQRTSAKEATGFEYFFVKIANKILIKIALLKIVQQTKWKMFITTMLD